jgi:hypothetical protein
MKRLSIAGLCLFAFVGCLSPRGVRAQQYVLDTGTPTSGTYPILNNADWFAAEFSVQAGETITQLSAYLSSISSGNGDNFAFDIYSNDSGAFASTRNAQLSTLLVYTATGTYSASGWNATSVDWVVPTSGDYWLAIEGDTSASFPPSFDAEEETSSGTGAVPALAFAYDSGTGFKTSTGVPIGLEVTAASVPEPAGWWFLAGGGVLMIWLRGDRRRPGRGIAGPRSGVQMPSVV